MKTDTNSAIRLLTDLLDMLVIRFLIVMAGVFGLFYLLLVIYSFMECNHFKFQTAADARIELEEKGWIPDGFPDSAKNIIMWTELDFCAANMEYEFLDSDVQTIIEGYEELTLELGKKIHYEISPVYFWMRRPNIKTTKYYYREKHSDFREYLAIDMQADKAWYYLSC